MSTTNKPNDVRVSRELLERLFSDEPDGYVTRMNARQELLALLAQPAEQHGEPVAWVECSPAWLKSGGDCATAPRICVGRNGISHLHPAHDQHATAKVVLPERRELSQSTPYLSDLDHEWNACLDEVAKLNPGQS